MNLWVTVLLPIATLILGYVGSLITEMVRDKRAAAAEKERRRAEFQRETLLEVLDGIFAMGRAVGAIHHQDLMADRRDGVPYGHGQIGSDLNQSAFGASVRLSILAQRIDDDDARRLVSEFKSATAEMIRFRGDTDGAEAHLLNTLLPAQTAAIERVGTVLREL